MINVNCTCRKKKCELHGNCDACREHHAQSKRQRPCERSKERKRKMLSFLLVTAFIMSVFGYVSTTVALSHGMITVFSVLFAILGIASLANGIVMGVNTVRAEKLKTRAKVGRYIWSILSILYFVFIVTFRFYNFWTL